MNQQQYSFQLKSAVLSTPHPQAPPPGLYRLTSVMALFLFAPEPYLLFIQKADREGYPWRNQMAFPGGHQDESDADALAAALRELEEELLIRRENVDVIGSLGHFQTINNRNIEAFCGIWNNTDTIEFDRSEISRVIHIPVQYLTGMHREKGYAGYLPGVADLTYPFEDVVIWGVTAKILHHMLELMTP